MDGHRPQTEVVQSIKSIKIGELVWEEIRGMKECYQGDETLLYPASLSSGYVVQMIITEIQIDHPVGQLTS